MPREYGKVSELPAHCTRRPSCAGGSLCHWVAPTVFPHLPQSACPSFRYFQQIVLSAFSVQVPSQAMGHRHESDTKSLCIKFVKRYSFVKSESDDIFINHLTTLFVSWPQFLTCSWLFLLSLPSRPLLFQLTGTAGFLLSFRAAFQKPDLSEQPMACRSCTLSPLPDPSSLYEWPLHTGFVLEALGSCRVFVPRRLVGTRQAAALGTEHHGALAGSCPGLSRHPCQARVLWWLDSESLFFVLSHISGARISEPWRPFYYKWRTEDILWTWKVLVSPLI